MFSVSLIKASNNDFNDEVVEWHQEDHAKRYSASGRKFTSKSLQDEYFRGLENKTMYQYMIHHIKDKKNIGIIKIGPIDHFHNKSDLIVFIGNKLYLKMGLASEAIQLANRIAFDELDIRKVHGPIFKSNIGAIKSYLKADWFIEAVLKGHYLVDNKSEDAILVACYNPKYFNKDQYLKSMINFKDIYNN